MPYIANGKVIPSAGSLVITPEERMRKEKIEEAKQLRADVYYNTREHGGFIFMKADESVLQHMDSATVGRLAYLSTFLSFEEQRLLDPDGTVFEKKDLSSILGVSRPTANNFFNQCHDAGILDDDGKYGVLLKDIFYKGKSNDHRIIKLYQKTIRQLYKRLPYKNHKYLGYIVQLVPWINYEWNIVCHNPLKKNYELAKPMMLKDICNILNYDELHSHRLTEALTGTWFEWDGVKQALCAVVNVNTEDARQNSLIVNPHLIFAGTDFKKVEEFGMSFVPRKKE